MAYPSGTKVTKLSFGWKVSYHGRKLGQVHSNRGSGRGWSAYDANGSPIGSAGSKEEAIALVWSREYAEIRGRALDAGRASGEFRLRAASRTARRRGVR